VSGGATTPNTTTLIEQLAEAHKVQRDQERRIAELLEEMQKQAHDTERSKAQRVGDIPKELEQCRKREDEVPPSAGLLFDRSVAYLSETVALTNPCGRPPI